MVAIVDALAVYPGTQNNLPSSGTMKAYGGILWGCGTGQLGLSHAQ